MNNLLEDVAALTDVSENTLRKFMPVITSSIGHSIFEGLCRNENIIEVDIEIGRLILKVEDEGVRYRFVPSKELEKTIVTSIKTHSSPILDKLETNLQQKLDCAYKEFI